MPDAATSISEFHECVYPPIGGQIKLSMWVVMQPLSFIGEMQFTSVDASDLGCEHPGIGHLEIRTTWGMREIR